MEREHMLYPRDEMMAREVRVGLFGIMLIYPRGGKGKRTGTIVSSTMFHFSNRHRILGTNRSLSHWLANHEVSSVFNGRYSHSKII